MYHLNWKKARYTIAAICISFSSSQSIAASGSCDDPASLENFSPSKRAMIERRCKERSERMKKEKNFHQGKSSWATVYFEDKPAMFKVYNNHAKMISGCPGGFDEIDCEPENLVTMFHEVNSTNTGITWIDRGSSNGGASYTCERYEFSADGAQLIDHKTYRC